MRSICTSIVATLVMAGTTLAATINVPDDQPTIAAAISASTSGDTINIAAGTYNEHSLNPGGKAITIQGTLSDGGTLATTIDAQQAGVVFIINSGEQSSTALVNIQITGGQASSNVGGIHIANSSPTITGCSIDSNQVSAGSPNGAVMNNGGGIRVSSGSPIFNSCTIADNSISVGSPNGAVMNNGGGMYVEGSSSVTLQDCTMSGNSSFAGGKPNGMIGNSGSAIYVQAGSITMTNCTFNGNTQSSTETCSAVVYAAGNVSVTGCSFTSNIVGGQYDPTCQIAPLPAVVAVVWGTLTVGQGCTFSGNSIAGMPFPPINSYSFELDTTGACCYDGLCFTMSEAECNTVGGTFATEACSADTSCPASCSSDSDNDGDVDVEDLLNLIDAWGACP